MRALLLLAMVGTAAADTRKDFEKLLSVERIEPASIAKLLGGKALGGQGDAWRIVELVPDGKLTLADVGISKLSHSVEPRGPHMPGTTHRWHNGKHDLLVNLDDRDQLTSIILTTDIAK